MATIPSPIQRHHRNGGKPNNCRRRMNRNKNIPINITNQPTDLRIVQQQKQQGRMTISNQRVPCTPMNPMPRNDRTSSHRAAEKAQAEYTRRAQFNYRCSYSGRMRTRTTKPTRIRPSNAKNAIRMRNKNPESVIGKFTCEKRRHRMDHHSALHLEELLVRVVKMFTRYGNIS